MVSLSQSDNMESQVKYLQSLESIRENCQQVFDLAKDGKSRNFDLNLSKMSSVSDMIIDLIKRDYGAFNKATLTKIPPHGRWLHFGDDRVYALIDKFDDKEEALEAVLDLFVVAVLLDAGAGNQWNYLDEATGKFYNRSEGLAVASYNMFMKGMFSSESGKLQVDAEGLEALKLEGFSDSFQVSDSNPLVGVEGRFNLLKRLAKVLKDPSMEYFKGEQSNRPSGFFHYLIRNLSESDNLIPIDSLWKVVMKGFGKVWPEAGAKIGGVSLGDVWSLPLADESELLIPFHKLSQWLTYSLMDPIVKLSKYSFKDAEKMTGLPEYRNGGLFVDLGVLTLKTHSNLPPSDSEGIPSFKVNDPVIVEWRALTVCLLDMVADDLRQRLGASKEELSLPMVLEAGTWKAGREIAAKLRPTSKNPPISIVSDGTVF